MSVKSERSTLVVLAGMIASLCAFAWAARWIQDDAYITFRYSENVVSGLGPVWNAGYAVEGYTNFLWMILIAAGMRLGLAPEGTSYALGIASFAASLVLGFRLARRQLGREDWALLATALIGTNYSFLMYATGGLETQLNATLGLALLVLATEAVDSGSLNLARAEAVSVLSSLAIMTRPDSVLVSGVVGCSLLWVLFEMNAAPASRRLALLGALLAPACLILGTWLTWKHFVYGRLLPNTFYAKVGSRRSGTAFRGLFYVTCLFVSYWWLPIAGGIATWAKVRGIPFRRFLSVPKAAVPLVAYAVIWLGYVVWIGGDIMEFRQLVPVIPVLILILTMLLQRAAPDLKKASPVAALLVVGSVVHGLFFARYVPIGFGAVPVLGELGSPDPKTNWKVIGMRLRDAFHSSRDVTIAVSPAGAIPFFSRARTIDVVGLNDLWIPQRGFERKKCQVCSSHSKLATVRYLVDSGVNLIIGHPQLVSYSTPCTNAFQVLEDSFYQELIDYENLPAHAQLLRIPLDGDTALATAYIKDDPRIDRLISAGVWKAQPIIQ